MTTTSGTEMELYNQLKAIEDNARTLQRVMSSPYPIGQTPKDVIWTLNKAKLYRYIPVVPAEQRFRTPLLLVFALMNRPTILDLRPGNSYIEYMVKRGFDVYLLDWGIPGPEDKNLKFEDYVFDYMVRAIRKVKATAGSDEFSMLGWCIGAILTSMYAAVRPDDGLKNLLLLTAPLDFTDKNCGTFVKWIDERFFDVDKILNAYGNMPGELLDYGAKSLKPVENYISNYVRLFENIDNPKIVESWHAMNTWVTDLTPMSGGTYRQLIVDIFRGNKLMTGEMMLRGQRFDFANIKASVLNVVANEDHIVPPCNSAGVMDKIGSADKQLLRIPGGHIGVMAGSAAVKRTWPQIDEWLEARSEPPATRA